MMRQEMPVRYWKHLPEAQLLPSLIREAGTRVRDDPYTQEISWPNFHSGANGDCQAVTPTVPLHPLLGDPGSPTGAIRYLPAHPHEGAVRAPEGADARVIATGTSKATGRTFNIAVAFEAGRAGVEAPMAPKGGQRFRGRQKMPHAPVLRVRP